MNLEEMKKQYIKPQIKAFAVRPQSLLEGSIIKNRFMGSIHPDARQANAFEDDEEEDNMWNSSLW